MHINEAIVHEINKEAKTNGAEAVSVRPRQIRWPVNTLLTNLANELTKKYADRLSGYGSVGDDPALHQFPVWLKSYHDEPVGQSNTFIDFTHNAAKLIAKEMSKEFLSTGSYALFLRYSSLGSDWMMVAMLKLEAGAGIDKVTMDLQESERLGIDRLNEAARINLTSWRNGDVPYLSFIKHAGRGEKVSNYFREALSCLHYTESRHHTSAVIQAIDDFVLTSPLIEDAKRKETRIAMRAAFAGHCSTNSEEVNLVAISALMLPTEPEAFQAFVREPENAEKYQINDRFKPDKKTYSGLQRLKARMGSVSLAFDVEDVRAKRVSLGADRASVVLSQPTTELIQQIQEHEQPTTTQ